MKNRKNPLFMPKGSVRAILILILTFAVIFANFQKVELSPDILIVWAGACGWYFGARSNETKI